MNKKVMYILIPLLILFVAYAGFRLIKHYNRLKEQSTQQAQSKQTSSTPAAPLHVKVFLVAVGDDGKTGTKIGCGDSLVSVQKEVPADQKNVTSALNQLFAIKEQNYGQSGLYNALYQSDLKLASADKDANGIQVIKITGTMKLGGECDNPRFMEQIKATVSQFKSGQNAIIWINDKLLNDAVSLK